ncbi:osmotically inducible protein C [Sphaerisporangium melleum]|uniref:Osmotically inducible protein C n=1 Tax=Sphaerisporangium melleum TaxID=321316 RepID=A0A917RQE4_9ACTN|nr:OsmC family protein [Sphaerisporangium melleum]GGL17842.1 osmotically inducible protein C [Sphaerisporangium melleum]GII74817.1 osmotically inducible protein C [Sphaerisporangium melleum]
MASVNVERTDSGYEARNGRGAVVAIGSGDEEGAFTPVELLLAAVGGCNIVSVEPLTAQRGHRLVRLAMTVEAEKAEPNLLGTVTITYDVELPEGDEKADEVFRAVAHRVHEKYCTVSRTLQEGVEVALEIPE